MTDAFEPSPPLPLASKLTRLAVIGVVLGGVAVGFAYAGGWLTPHRLTPAKLVGVFSPNSPAAVGFRRNHAKGVCVTGSFASSGAGERLSKASLFAANTATPVVGRFSVGGGMPRVDDATASVLGLGLQLSTADGQTWRTAMISLPVFPVHTPQAFYELQVATAPVPGTGKPDGAKVGAFAAAHPEFVAAITYIKSQPPSPPGFVKATFHGLDAFWFTNAAGASTPVRWVFEPEMSATSQSTPASQPSDPNALFDGAIAAIANTPARWHLILIVGRPGDPTDDANQLWPADRERVDAGTLTLDRVIAEDDTRITDLNFDPLVLPDGITPLDDPLLSARSAAYAKSFRLRAGEAGSKPPSAVTPADIVAKGASH